MFGAGADLIFVAVMALLALSLRAARPGAPALWIVGGGVPCRSCAHRAAGLEHLAQRRPAVAGQARRSRHDVGVTGRMWWWEVRYRDPAGGRDDRAPPTRSASRSAAGLPGPDAAT
jgi:cytochrome c oxidase subunit 2